VVIDIRKENTLELIIELIGGEMVRIFPVLVNRSKRVGY